MINFKTYFYQTLNESPDKTRAGIKYTNWEQPDSRAFIVSPDFYCFSLKPKTTHARMLASINDLVKNQGLKIKNGTVWENLWIGGDLSVLKPILKLPGEQMVYRSNLLRYSQSHGHNIVVGRLWISTKVVSVWNGIQDLSTGVLNRITDLAGERFQIDLGTSMWEVFDQRDGTRPVEQAYTLDELESRLGEKSGDVDYEDKHTEKLPQWNTLHLTPPEQKGQVMKNMGIKPKTALGAQARFLRGESYEF